MSSQFSNSIINQQFWKTFGQYMAPVPSAGGDKINWINYKTGVKYFRFTMQQIEGNMVIAVELSNPDIVAQSKEYDDLSALKEEFFTICGDGWLWTKLATDVNGRVVSSISISLKEVNILRENDWSAIISFLKLYLICLDNFWNNYKYIFQF